jgi:hypothetical protein
MILVKRCPNILNYPLLYLQTGTGTFLIILPVKGLNLVPAQSYLWISGSLGHPGL